MIKLNSFRELEVPDNLFPLDAAIFLEAIASRSINFLAGMPLEEVNQSLAFVHYMWRNMRQMHKHEESEELNEIIKDIVKRNLDNKDRFSPPEKETGTDKLFTQVLDSSFLSNASGYLKANISDNDKVKEVSGFYKKFYGTLSLYYYILGIRIAAREKRDKRDNDSRYYRLGKSASCFFTSNLILDKLSEMQSEISAISHKESQLKEMRKENTSKGGKRKNDYYRDIKTKCIEMYVDMHTDKSNRKASQSIYNELNKSDQLIFKGDDPAHQIALWIGQYNRGTLEI